MTDPLPAGGPGLADEVEEAIGVLRTVADHPDPRFHLSLLLVAAQDHLIEMLESVVYLVLRGGPDTGKSTAVAVTMALCRNGIVLGGASGPYLRDRLGAPGEKDHAKRNRAVGISELGLLLKENSQVLALLRNGNKRQTSVVGLKIPKGRGWVNADVDTFGVKVTDAHGDLDPHVLGRSLVWDTVQSKSLRVALEAEYAQERVAPARDLLARRAEAARAAGWTKERVKEALRSSDFLRRVHRMFGNVYARHGVVCAHLLLLNDILGLNREADIVKIMDSQVPEISDSAQMLKEVIMDEAGAATENTELAVAYGVDSVLTAFNEARKQVGLSAASSITAELRELGFNQREQDWVPAKRNMKGPCRGRAVIRPFKKVQTWRAERGDAAATPPGTTIAMVARIAQPDGTVQPLQPVQPRSDDPWDQDESDRQRRNRLRSPSGTDPEEGNAS